SRNRLIPTRRSGGRGGRAGGHVAPAAWARRDGDPGGSDAYPGGGGGSLKAEDAGPKARHMRSDGNGAPPSTAGSGPPRRQAASGSGGPSLWPARQRFGSATGIATASG